MDDVRRELTHDLPQSRPVAPRRPGSPRATRAPASDAASGVRARAPFAEPGRAPAETAARARRRPAPARARRAGRRTPRSHPATTTDALRAGRRSTSSSAVSAPPIRPVGFRKRTLTANAAERRSCRSACTMSVSLASISFLLRMILHPAIRAAIGQSPGHRNRLKHRQVGLEDVGAGLRTWPVTKNRSAFGTKIVSPSRIVTLADSLPAWMSRRLTVCTSASRPREASAIPRQACFGCRIRISRARRRRRRPRLRQRLDERHRAGQRVSAGRAHLAHHEHVLTAKLLDLHGTWGLRR